MKPVNYRVLFIVFLSLAAGHLFLDKWLLLAAWVIVGLTLAITRQRLGRWFFPAMFLLDILIGVTFLVFWWNRHGQLTALAQNSSFPFWEWSVLAIAVNSITVLLCVYASYSVIRLFRPLVAAKK